MAKRTLQRRFAAYLEDAPTFQIRRNQSVYLIIDGTYFTGDLSLVIYYDSAIRYTQMYRLTIGDKNIPKSTNALESFFGHLKDNLSIHRGLSHKNRRAFIQWYLHFRNQSRN